MNLMRPNMAKWLSWIKSNDKEIIAILNDSGRQSRRVCKTAS